MLQFFLRITAGFSTCLIGYLIAIGSAQAQQHSESAEQETAVYSALSMGTGWALTHRHIVTNFHVIDGAKNLRLVTSEQKEIPVRVILVDKSNALAVLAILDEKLRLNPLPLALTKPRLGTQVFTIGYPHPNLLGTSPKLTSGFINATNGLADDPRTFQVSVPVQAGNSGGPLLNMRGEVVGVITSKLSAQKMFEWTGDIPQNVNYAIKINRLSSLISELETDEQVKAGGADNNQDLESLAEKVIDSVIIVAGDGDEKASQKRHALFSGGSDANEVKQDKKNTFVLYAYVEPESFHDKENFIGKDDTVYHYSKSVIEVLKQQIANSFGKQNEFVVNSGKSSKRLFYRLEENNFSSHVCSKNKASNIIAVYSEDVSGRGTHFKPVVYRMIDCSNLKEFKKEYNIVRDELHDTFSYEVALHTSFKDFIIKTPPYLNWAKN